MNRKEKNNNRKGFLFVVTIFLILTYILLSVSVWVKSIEASERSYSEFYKESNVELAMDQITDRKIAAVSSTVLNRALFILNNQSIDHPIRSGSTEDEFRYVNKSFGEWLYNGSPSSSNFEDGVAPSEYDSSLSKWVSDLNGSLSAIGVYVDSWDVRGFNMSQTDLDTLNYTYELDLSMTDKSGTTTISRTYQVSGNVNITGLPDPAVARASAGSYQILGKRFYFLKYAYKNPDSVKPYAISTGTVQAGQGWFYGYLTSVTDAPSVPLAERKNYILVGDYIDMTTMESEDVDWRQFGAFIVTSEIKTLGTCTSGGVTYKNEENTFNPVIYEGASCTPKKGGTERGQFIQRPFIVLAPNAAVPEGFDITSAPFCPDPSTGQLNRRCAIFVTAAEIDPQHNDLTAKNKHPSAMGSYDVEQIRDYALCGYYMNDTNAPSYEQRLMKDAYSRKSDRFGISTFLIGNYVHDSLGDKHSRLDYEMFAGTSGTFIKGMPGCKELGMCSLTQPPETGIFALSNDAITDYGLDAISCGNSNLAGCD